MKVNEAIADFLRQKGITHVFGIPGGGSSTDLINAFGERDISFELTAHETSAAMMAAVYGDLTGKPGVCLSIMGPGATNLLSGVAYGYLERSPLIAITERHAEQNYYHIATQKIDQLTLFGPVTKWSKTVTPATVLPVMEEAYRIAREERPGPVHLDLPNDVSRDVMTGDNSIENITETRTAVDQYNINLAVDLIKKSTKPLFIIGNSVNRCKAVDKLTTILERHQIPFMLTLKGKGLIPEDHRLYFGVFSGAAIENYIFDQADLLILAGVDPVELLPKKWDYKQPVIYIDFVPARREIFPVDVELAGNINATIDALATCDLGGNHWQLKEIEAYSGAVVARLSDDSRSLTTDKVVNICRSEFPRNTLVCNDIGTNCTIVNYLWKSYSPRTFFSTKGFSTMGFSIPAAIAAKMINPEREVLAFVGDGSFFMRLGELEVLARKGLSLVIVVFTDGYLNLIYSKQQKKGYSPFGVKLYSPDICKLAEGFGGKGLRVGTEQELRDAIKVARNYNGFTVIDAKIDPAVSRRLIENLRG